MCQTSSRDMLISTLSWNCGRDFSTPARIHHSVTTTIADAHRYAVRDVDYNPNKPFCIVTCGEDRLIKFWDLRSLDAPIKSMVGHDHW